MSICNKLYFSICFVFSSLLVLGQTLKRILGLNQKNKIQIVVQIKETRDTAPQLSSPPIAKPNQKPVLPEPPPRTNPKQTLPGAPPSESSANGLHLPQLKSAGAQSAAPYTGPYPPENVARPVVKARRTLVPLSSSVVLLCKTELIATANMDSEGAATGKPHVVCIPAPAQSHMKAMLDFAKLLYHRGFHVTFVNTELTHRRLLESMGPNSLDGLPGFRFVAIPDENAGTRDRYARKNLLAPLRDLATKLNHTVTCIVSDGFMLISSIVAQELAIPIALYFTIPASGLMACKQFRALKDKGLTPLKDDSYLTNGYLDQVVDWIPGMKDIRLRDLPSYVRTTDPNDVLFEFSMESAEKACKSSAVIVHTFDALERDVLDALSSIFPRICAIGPLPLFVKEIPGDSLVKSVGHSLWKEDTECLQWLDSWPPNSVLYVNFGSTTVMKPEQVLEFCWGLANSNHPFLWIIRPSLVIGDAAILPAEFMESTRGRGMVTSWCPQEQVLNHQAVGGFLTHCGWNSTIESICAGVPMLCWPVFGDQMTNCRYICREWEIGMEIDSGVKSDEVDKLVRELMEGEKSKKMRSKAMEWKRKAEEATGVHGSSSIALDNLVNEVLLSKQHI